MTFPQLMCRFGWVLALGAGVLGWVFAPVSSTFSGWCALPPLVLLLLAGIRSVLRRSRSSTGTEPRDQRLEQGSGPTGEAAAPVR